MWCHLFQFSFLCYSPPTEKKNLCDDWRQKYARTAANICQSFWLLRENGEHKKCMINRFVSIKFSRLCSAFAFVFSLSLKHTHTEKLSHIKFICIICDLLVSFGIYKIFSVWALHWLRQTKFPFMNGKSIDGAAHVWMMKYSRWAHNNGERERRVSRNNCCCCLISYIIIS